MKKIYFLPLLLSVFMLSSLDSKGQLAASDPEDNLIKVNVTAIPLGNFSFQYERRIGEKSTAALGFRFMPEGDLPLKSVFQGLLDEDDELRDRMDHFKTGNFAITPEYRYYTGGEAFRGFYLAPFVRYAQHSASLPYDYEYEYPVDETTTETRQRTIDLDGQIKTFTGGLMIGAQWKLSKLVYLDWWILGPQYGVANGKIDGVQQGGMAPHEQEGLREQLADLEDIPLLDVESTVTAEGAKVDFSGPWAGVRAGLSIGFRF